jgi:hypothetical protein
MEELAMRVQPFGPEVSQAIHDFSTAIKYLDKTLIDSSLNAVFESMARLAHHVINREIEASVTLTKALQETWGRCVDGVPWEDFDELRKVIESYIDERIARMITARDNLAKLDETHYPIVNMPQLDETIRDLQRFKANVFSDWPTSNRQPSPINRQLIEDAKAAIARGEKGMRREDLIWCSDRPRKATE